MNTNVAICLAACNVYLANAFSWRNTMKPVLNCQCLYAYQLAANQLFLASCQEQWEVYSNKNGVIISMVTWLIYLNINFWADKTSSLGSNENLGLIDILMSRFSPLAIEFRSILDLFFFKAYDWKIHWSKFLGNKKIQVVWN